MTSLAPSRSWISAGCTAAPTSRPELDLGHDGPDGRPLTHQTIVAIQSEGQVGISLPQLLPALRRLQAGEIAFFEKFDDRRDPGVRSRCLGQCVQPSHKRFMAFRHFCCLLLGKAGTWPAEDVFRIIPKEVGGDVDRLLDLGGHDEFPAAAVFATGSDQPERLTANELSYFSWL